MDVLALFHGDGRVHRAKLQALGEIYAKVKFVDFGNSDDVTYDCIFQYDPNLFPYPDLVKFKIFWPSWYRDGQRESAFF